MNGPNTQLTFLSAEPPANPSPSRDFARDLLTLEATSHSPFLQSLNNIAPAGWSGRTSPECCQTKAGRLEPSSEGWGNSGMGSPTGFLTLNTSEWPKDAAVCLLSDMLEDNGSVARRFYLSAKACAGILRRAERRGKVLPPALELALRSVASMPRTKPTAATPNTLGDSSPKVSYPSRKSASENLELL